MGITNHDFECYAECIAETAMAILVKIDDNEHWIPKSQIGVESDVWNDGDEGMLSIPQWLAENEGLC